MKLARITVYPLKSVAGTDLAASHVDPLGLRGDRRWAVIDPNGHVLTRRELPRLAMVNAVSTPDGLSLSYEGERLDVPFPAGHHRDIEILRKPLSGVEDAGNFASHFLSSALDRETRLVYFPDSAERAVSASYAPPGHFTSLTDGYPILITTTVSLAETNAELAAPVQMRRFRPNIVIDGDFAPWEEDTWRVIRIGSTILRIVKPCERCVMVTQDPDTGEQTDPKEPLATLRRIHKAANGKIIFGQNAIVEEEGEIVLGDRVEILERSRSNLLDLKR